MFAKFFRNRTFPRFSVACVVLIAGLSMLLSAGLFPGQGYATGMFDGEWVGKFVTDDEETCLFQEVPVTAKVEGSKFVGHASNLGNKYRFEGEIDDEGKLTLWSKWEIYNGYFRKKHKLKLTGSFAEKSFEGTINVESLRETCFARVYLTNQTAIQEADRKTGKAEPKADEQARDATKGEAKRKEEEARRNADSRDLRETILEQAREKVEEEKRDAERKKQAEQIARAKQEGEKLEALLGKEGRTLMQFGLKEQGFLNGEADGDFGKETRRAIQMYESSKGQSPTGYLTATEAAELKERGQTSVFFAESEKRRREIQESEAKRKTEEEEANRTAEAERKAEAEKARLAAQAERKQQEEEANRTAESERKAEEEKARLIAQAERKQQEEEANRTTESERKAEEEKARLAAQAERKQQEEEANRTTESERKAEEEKARLIAQAEGKRKVEEEARQLAETDLGEAVKSRNVDLLASFKTRYERPYPDLTAKADEEIARIEEQARRAQEAKLRRRELELREREAALKRQKEEVEMLQRRKSSAEW